MANESESVKFESPIAQCIWNAKEEASAAKQNRMIRNRENFDSFHLQQDFSHKRKGQSKEFLAKQSIATEQLASFLQQGLMDFGQWFRIEADDGVKPDDLKIKPEEIEKLLLRQLQKNKFSNFFNDTLKFGLLGSLMIVKVIGKKVRKSSYDIELEDQPQGESDFPNLIGKKTLVRKDKDVWELSFYLVRQEDYFPDPTGDKLYEIEVIEMDWHVLRDIALKSEHFDLEKIDLMQSSQDEMQKARKSRETRQNVTYSGHRKRVTLLQYWGTFIEQGTGKVLYRDCVATIDTQGNVIEKPHPIEFWHGESPFVASPILRVGRSVWHKALMDAATRHNIAENELFNLILDGAMMDVHGIKQLRASWMEDPSQASEGIPPAETILVNSQCPPGAKVLERVDTSSLTPEAINVLNLIDREFQQSAFTNDTRLGNVPQRAVKATEIVASNQSLTGVMNGIVKVIETEMVEPLLRKAWLVMAQHMNDLDSKEVAAILGEERAVYISSLTPEELFSLTSSGYKYKVFGLSTTLNKIQDFRKITALLQSIGSSPDMMAEFRKKYSFTKLLGEIVKSLDIEEDKIEASPEELQQAQMENQLRLQAMAAQAQGSGNTQGGEGKNPQSQIPQAGSTSQETGMSVQRGANNVGMTQPG